MLGTLKVFTRVITDISTANDSVPSPVPGYKVDYEDIDTLFSQVKAIRLKPVDQFYSKFDPETSGLRYDGDGSNEGDHATQALGKRNTNPGSMNARPTGSKMFHQDPDTSKTRMTGPRPSGYESRDRNGVSSKSAIR